MQAFPILKNNQVALFKSDYQTGSVLDEHNNIAIHADQKVYIILNSIESALDYAKMTLTNHVNVECTILDKSAKLIYFFDSLSDFINKTTLNEQNPGK